MAKRDLDALAAPVEDLVPAIRKVYEALDAEWEAVAKRLKKIPIPGSIRATIASDEWDRPFFTDLCWQKYKGRKRFCIVQIGPDTLPSGEPVIGDLTTTPYDEWSGEEKAELRKHIPALFKAAEKKMREFIDLANF